VSTVNVHNFHRTNTTGVTKGAGTVYSSGVPDYITNF